MLVIVAKVSDNVDYVPAHARQRRFYGAGGRSASPCSLRAEDPPLA